MFVADHKVTLKNKEGWNDITNGMVEKLDRTLSDYGIQHFFTLPEGDEEGFVINDEEEYYLFYNSKDADEVFMIYALWMKRWRGISEKELHSGMKKYLIRKGELEDER